MDRFSKRYAVIDHNINANTQLRFKVTSRFPVHTFGGRKAIIISTDAPKSTILPALIYVMSALAAATMAGVCVQGEFCRNSFADETDEFGNTEEDVEKNIGEKLFDMVGMEGRNNAEHFALMILQAAQE